VDQDARPNRVLAHWRRLEPTQRLRYVLLVLGLASLGAVAALPAGTVVGSVLPPATAVAGVAILAGVWIYCTYRGGFPIWVDAAELAALAVIALALGRVSPILGPMFVATWLRGLYGGNLAAIVRYAGYVVVAVTMAAVLQAALPGTHVGTYPLVIAVWLVPCLAMVTVGIRALVTLLRRMRDGEDLTDRIREQLSYQSRHDALTALPNRTAFADALAERLPDRQGTLAVLVIDLDDFKTVNDSLGHGAGDTLLAEVADRLGRCLRGPDVPARLGGDEFGVLLDGLAGVADAEAVAARVLDAMDQPFLLGSGIFHVHSSIGIAVVEPDEEVGLDRGETLLRDADLAMYVAKARGKNRYEVFSEDMAAAIAEDRTIREEMSRALRRDELELHFQPIFSLVSGRVQLVEALVRWRHPRRGLLSPGAFLPQADRCGLLADIEQWVIAAACRAAAEWPDPAPVVSVNISPRHLARPWLVPAIAGALAESGLPGERLLVEITEESMVEDPVGAAENLRACSALGVRVAAAVRHPTGTR
jgi:diguanylate cyclase (GGDEF)-like protein